MRLRLVWRIALPLSALALALGGGLLGLGWRASGRALRPPPATSPWRLADFPALAPEPVSFVSRTGVTIAGRYFPGRSRAAVILTHGYGGNQDELLPVASFLHDAGFGVLTYDSRGCGASGGTLSFGALEQLDLRSAVDYLVARPDVDPGKIGAFGFSMGAATTIMAAADDARIAAVVDDSGWADAYSWLRPGGWSDLLHPNDRFSSLSLAFVERRAGLDLGALRPVEVVGRLAPRPILIIHGAADDVVLPGDSERVYAAAGEPRELWLVPGLAHGATIQPPSAAYAARVVAFYRQALRP